MTSSWKRHPFARPQGRCVWCLCEFIVWTKFWCSSFRIVFNVVLYSTALYRESTLYGRQSTKRSHGILLTVVGEQETRTITKINDGNDHWRNNLSPGVNVSGDVLCFNVRLCAIERQQDSFSEWMRVRVVSWKWKSFQHYWPFVTGIQWSLLDSPHKGPVIRTSDDFLVFPSKRIWINRRIAGDLRGLNICKTSLWCYNTAGYESIFCISSQVTWPRSQPMWEDASYAMSSPIGWDRNHIIWDSRNWAKNSLWLND